jgi:hypothetical protein
VGKNEALPRFFLETFNFLKNIIMKQPIVKTPKPLTEQQKNEALMRAYMQQRSSMAQGILFNAFQHQEPSNELVDKCVAVAEYAVAKIFGMELSKKEPEK